MSKQVSIVVSPMSSTTVTNVDDQTVTSPTFTTVNIASPRKDGNETVEMAPLKGDENAAIERANSDYLSYLSLLTNAWTDKPDVTISYDKLAYTLQTRTDVRPIPNMAFSLYDFAMALTKPYTYYLAPPPTKPFHAMRPASGVIRPSTMTLILAPPGHSKSLFLKSLAGRFTNDSRLEGEIRWNGLNAKEAAAAGLQIHKLTAYVEQVDNHIPQLTVRETFQYAVRHATADVSLLDASDALKENDAKKVELMIDLLGLRECADTVVGDALLRGVSGGQKKRVSVGEMLLLNSRVLLLDEITTGLDSSSAFDILKLLREWTRLMNGSVVTALLQPSPEIFALFDDLILMREGQIVYHGPANQVIPYLENLGFSTPNDQDTADYLTELMTYPRAVYFRNSYRAARRAQLKDGRPQQSLNVPMNTIQPASPQIAVTIVSSESSPTVAAASADPNAPSTTAEAGDLDKHLLLAESRTVPLTRKALLNAFNNSSFHTELQVRSRETLSLYPNNTYMTTIKNYSEFTRSSFAQPFTHSIFRHTFINLMRQSLLTIRNKADLIPRIGQNIIMGLVFGSLFVNLDHENYFTRNGVITFAIIFTAFNNLVEIPHTSQAKTVVWKQYEAGFYPTGSYVISQVLMQALLAIIAAFFFTLPIYFLVGLVDNAGRYFFFTLIVICVNLFFAGVFRCITYLVGHADIANQLAGPITFASLLFSGFLIQYEQIPHWMWFIYWLSPFSWALRSLAQNEYFDESYFPPAQADPNQNEHAGIYFLQQSGFDTTWAYKWAAVGYLLGMFFIFSYISTLLLANVRQLIFLGTKRNEDEEEAEDAAEDNSNKLIKSPSQRISNYLSKSNMSGSHAIASTALPFIPIDLVWSHITYTIQVTKEGKSVPRALLNDVSGYARAGTLTALMGSSGAGKTTLMDVLAGRKTGGKIEGAILVNGFPKENRTFNRVVGYVEQSDIHNGRATIEEALHFSARLRLPREITEERRIAFVTEVLEILELKSIQNRLIDSLSPGQLKRVTIGVELVANPPILFLDEPTSGLDSRAALIVMRVVKRIAQSGRAVLCTIHQPSSELFYFFDRVQVLQSGGLTAFFGDLGEYGASMIDYFQNAPIANSAYRPELPANTNPASWMLEVIGAGTAIKTSGLELPNYSEIYNNSKLKQNNEDIITQLSVPKVNSTKLSFTSEYATSFLTQLQVVMWRLFITYWRDTAYNWTRFGVLLAIAIVTGLLYLNTDPNSQASTISQLSAIYVGLGFIGTANVASALPVLIKLRAVFYRERAAYTYFTFPYALSIAIVEIPYLIVGCIIFVIPFYFMIGLQHDAGKFFATFLIYFLSALTFTYWGQFLASALPDLVAANILQGLSVTFFFLFGGIFIPKSQMPSGWRWFYYLDPIPKGLIAISREQFQCGDDCATFPVVGFGAPAGAVVNHQEFVGSFLSMEFDVAAFADNVGWLLLTAFIFHFIMQLAIHNISHIKR